MRRGHTRRQSPAGPTLLFRDKLSPCPFSQPAFSCLPQVLFRPPLFFLPRLTSEYRRERGNVHFPKVKERFNLEVSAHVLGHFTPYAGCDAENNCPLISDARTMIKVGAGRSLRGPICTHYAVDNASRNATLAMLGGEELRVTTARSLAKARCGFPIACSRNSQETSGEALRLCQSAANASIVRASARAWGSIAAWARAAATAAGGMPAARRLLARVFRF